MSREYAISKGGVTLVGSTPGQNTLLWINPAAAPSPGIEILRIWITQKDITASTQQRVQFVTQVTSFPTLTSVTPAKLKQGDPASAITGNTTGAAGTCGVNASAEGAGSKSVIWEDTFSVLSGFLWVPTTYETIILQAGSASGFGVYFPVAPGTLTNWAMGMTYRELG